MLSRLGTALPADHPPGVVEPAPPDAAAARPSLARLRVPVIREGADPGEAFRPACEVIEWLSLDASELPPAYRERVVRPFAFRLGEDGIRRVRHRFEPGGHAIVLRDFMPLSPGEVYAARLAGRVVLSQVLWNGRALLLLPSPGRHDFEVLEAPDEATLRSLMLGVAFRVRPRPERNATLG